MQGREEHSFRQSARRMTTTRSQTHPKECTRVIYHIFFLIGVSKKNNKNKMETQNKKNNYPLFGVILTGCIFGGMVAVHLSLADIKQGLDNVQAKLQKRDVSKKQRVATTITEDTTHIGADLSLGGGGDVSDDNNKDNSEGDSEEDGPPE